MSLATQLTRVAAELELDLGGRVVLTEAATGPYVVTPVLAALAGAQVYAYTKPTRYGTVAEVAGQTMALAAELGVDLDRLCVLGTLPDRVVARADIITNSGHLRPLDASWLRHARSDAVVALMFEAWEIRPEDMDLDYLRSRGIRVVATNERHPDVDVFGYLGELAVRQIHLAGLSLARNRYVLYCNNPFGPYLAKTLSAVCAELIVIDERGDRAAYGDGPITWFDRCADFARHLPRDDISGIVLAAYPFDREWIGLDSGLHPQFLRDNLPGAIVLRFAGHVEESAMRRFEVAHYPGHVPAGHMGSLLSELGPDPVIRLQAGSLKAAEVALNGGSTYHGQPILEWV